MPEQPGNTRKVAASKLAATNAMNTEELLAILSEIIFMISPFLMFVSGSLYMLSIKSHLP